MEKTKIAVWQRWDNLGLEYLKLTEIDSTVLVGSLIIAVEDNVPFQLRYRLRCDENYQVQRVTIALSGQSSIFMARKHGRWFDVDNHPLPAFDDCDDIDISATPFTNTLPIRRLEWQPGQSRSLNMIYIRIPELTIERVTQRYSCIERNVQSSLFEYSQPGFSAILPIDADGFVQNYPELFRRLS